VGNQKIRKSFLAIYYLFSYKKFCSQPDVKYKYGTKKNFIIELCSSYSIIFWSAIFDILKHENEY